MISAFTLAMVATSSAIGQLNGRAVTEDIFYQIMPIAWRDSNNDAQRFGDFGGLTASLDYLDTLGVTAVWINPIFPSPAYHGYQHGPADQVNPWFGTEAEFQNFVQQAHAHGIKVFLDFVAYGISQNSIYYQGALGNPASPYDPWLAFTNAANTTYDGSVYSTWNGSSVGFVEWDLRNPSAASQVTNSARKWLDPNNDGDPSDGIDGFRLDHALESNDHGPSGWGYNLADFWVPWNASLRALKPGVFTFAEPADWGLTGATLMPAFDSTFTKPWEFAVRDALSSELSASLYSSTASTLAQMPPGRYFLGTIDDHDVDRLTSVIGGSLAKAKVAAAILMTGPFPPIIYYGDEIGMLGTKGNYGSDANDIPMREPFKWNAAAGPPMSNYFVLNSQAYTNRFAHDNDGRSVQEQLNVSGSLLETYRQLIAARKGHIALRRGQYIPITNSDTRVWSFVRHQPGQETLFVAIRVRNTSATPTFNLSGFTIPGGTSTVTDLLTGQTLTNLTDANKGAYGLTLGAYAFRILSINAAPTPPPASPIDGVDIPLALGSFSLVATQTNPTPLGDNISELDQLFVRPLATGLRIGLTGNLLADGTGLAIFFDTVTGGQNVLNFAGFAPPPSGPNLLTGLRFDAGFTPDQMLFINTAGGTIYADQFALPTSGAISKTYRGSGKVGSGNGNLTGGTNPNVMKIAMNNTNVAGVTGASAAAAGSAQNGFDLFVPYADVGLPGPGGVVRISAFILRSSGVVTNQCLPGLPSGTANPGLAPNLVNVAGDQFAVVLLVIPGDIDGDTVVGPTDVSAIVQVLLGVDTNPAHVAAADLNHDGATDGRDVSPFVSVFIGT